MKNKHFYEHLVYTIGTELNIHIRQRLYIINDKLVNQSCLGQSKMTKISSGSLSEGLDLPGSDVEVLYFLKNVNVVQSLQNIKHPIQHTTLEMESDNDHPGFTRLRLIADRKDEYNINISKCCESTINGRYLSVKAFLHNIKAFSFSSFPSAHGHCLPLTDQVFDTRICLRSKSFPVSAIPWVMRHRQQWPPKSCN